MIVKEVTEKLNQFNPQAEMSVIVHNRSEHFSITWGESEGETKSNCRKVNFYVDRLCKNEHKHIEK